MDPRTAVCLTSTLFAILVVASPGCTPGGRTSEHPAEGGNAAADPAACVQAVADHQRRVQAHLDGARVRMNARDGQGCILELDAFDRADPWAGGLSTNAASPMAMTRAMCLMLASQCPAGKALYRQALLDNAGATMGPEVVDRSVDSVASLYCEGGALAPRDELLRALMELSRGAYMSRTDAAACQRAYATAKRLLPTVPPRDDDDSQIKQARDAVRVSAPECLARAGDCDGARAVFDEAWTADKKIDPAMLRTLFESVVRRSRSS